MFHPAQIDLKYPGLLDAPIAKPEPKKPVWEQLLEAEAAKARARVKDAAPRNIHRTRADGLAEFGCFFPEEIADTSVKGRARILRHMSKALKREVNRRDQRHFSYNKNRHERMLDAFKRERLAFEAITDTKWTVAQ